MTADITTGVGMFSGDEDDEDRWVYGPRWVPPSERVRRLYCLTCGEGTASWLPADWFVLGHVKEHVISKKDEATMFVVVSRGKDRTLRLGDKLEKMLTDETLEWGGAFADIEDESNIEESDYENGKDVT